MQSSIFEVRAAPPSIASIIVMIVVIVGLLYIFYPAISDRYKRGDECVSEDKLTKTLDAIEEDTSVLLSLVIPAYNEEKRLTPMLDLTIDHLTKNRSVVVSQCHQSLLLSKNNVFSKENTCTKRADDRLEIIIVNDGSKDKTIQVLRDFIAEVEISQKLGNFISVRLLTLRKNSGKGAAVRAGMLRSRGELCLMVDADGATEFGDGLEKVLKKMCESRRANEEKRQNATSTAAVVFGSRAHLKDDSITARSPIRTFLMEMFHFFVNCLCSRKIQDTQCGFKLFTRHAAIVLFTNLHLRRWAFDTELVVMAERLQISMAEVGVKWHEVDGSKLGTSKLALAFVSAGMLRDMICVKACYTLGLWSLKR